jgi:hypothetical protein
MRRFVYTAGPLWQQPSRRVMSEGMCGCPDFTTTPRHVSQHWAEVMAATPLSPYRPLPSAIPAENSDPSAEGSPRLAPEPPGPAPLWQSPPLVGHLRLLTPQAAPMALAPHPDERRKRGKASRYAGLVDLGSAAGAEALWRVEGGGEGGAFRLCLARGPLRGWYLAVSSRATEDSEVCHIICHADRARAALWTAAPSDGASSAIRLQGGRTQRLLVVRPCLLEGGAVIGHDGVDM